MKPGLCLSVLAPQLNYDDDSKSKGAPRDSVIKADNEILTPHDLRRIQKYAAALVDHHLIGYLVPPLARAYFAKRIPVTLSYTQAAILLILGLQLKTVDESVKDLDLPGTQVMALFNKAVRRIHGSLLTAREADVEAALPSISMPELRPHAVGLDEELEEGYVLRDLALRARNVLKSLEMMENNIDPELYALRRHRLGGVISQRVPVLAI